MTYGATAFMGAVFEGLGRTVGNLHNAKISSAAPDTRGGEQTPSVFNAFLGVGTGQGLEDYEGPLADQNLSPRAAQVVDQLKGKNGNANDINTSANPAVDQATVNRNAARAAQEMNAKVHTR